MPRQKHPPLTICCFGSDSLLNFCRDIAPIMARMRLKTAIQKIQQYFAPLLVSVELASPITMDLVLVDPVSNESVTLLGIPCRRTVTPVQLYQLINLIETQTEARQPGLF